MIPALIIVDHQMLAHAFDHYKQVINTIVNVGSSRIGISAEHVCYFWFLIFIKEIPYMIIWAQLVSKSSSHIVDLTLFNRVKFIFLPLLSS